MNEEKRRSIDLVEFHSLHIDEFFFVSIEVPTKKIFLSTKLPIPFIHTRESIINPSVFNSDEEKHGMLLRLVTFHLSIL